MPRKGHVPRRKVLPDPIYNSKLVTRLINNIMHDGKKGSHNRFYTARLNGLPKPRTRSARSV